MVRVRAAVTRWESDEVPGWIELSVVDAAGKDHRIVEKVPVLTTMEITSESAFPLEIWLGVEAGQVHCDKVAVTFLHGIETVNGASELVVSAADVIGV